MAEISGRIHDDWMEDVDERQEQVRAARLKPVDEFVGMQLRKERRKRHMSLVDVSASLGVSYQQLQKYERAQSRVAVSTLYRLAELYEFKMEHFFEAISQEVALRNRDGAPLGDVGEDSQIGVLVAEANPADEKMTRSALSNIDKLDVLCVHDGCQILDVLKYKTLCPHFPKPSIVFLDIYIPKRDGISVLKELKREENTKDIPVIVTTDNISDELVSRAYKLGAAGYILKTPDYNAFKESIVNCVKYWTETVIVPKDLRCG